MEVEIEMMPDRNRSSRAYVVSTLPSEISSLYWKVRKKHGVVFANIVLYAYQSWGPRAAVQLARRMLEFDSPEELFSFLEDRVRKLGKGADMVAKAIFTYKYRHYMSKLTAMKEVACDWGLTMEIFHTLARAGLFYPVDCIVNVANFIAGCDRITNKCMRLCRTLEDLTGESIC